ncbi:glycosyltransferase family 2 protein [Helicobacter sp. T3_23-1059]
MTDLQNPKFSIIIPMYNVEKFIARAIESAINQSYENIEIICVDDCGGDRSVEIAKDFALSDKRVKTLQNPQNLGTFATRNNGALSAKGEYLLFLDSDDYLHPDTCQKCYEMLENANKEQIDFIMFNFLGQDKKDGEFKLWKAVGKTQIVDRHGFEAIYFGKDTGYNIATKCIKKATYLKALEFANVRKKLTLAEDILASVALLGVSNKIMLFNYGLYYYAHNDNSATRSLEPQKVQERIENLDFVIDKFTELATKKDREYEVFLQCLIKILQTHIIREKIHPYKIAYHKRIEKGYPKWLARLIWSLQKRRFGAQAKERDLCNFVKENKGVFQKI